MKDSIMDPITEKKMEVKELIHTIMEMPNTDELPLIRQLAIHLHRLLRIRVITPPISEVMITLQSEKPKLYHATRLSLPEKSHLSILFEINGDEHLAKERLQSFLND
ncbi:hypothetical protein [Brevibacillus migulae]|uniref:hypothetical protein n=1 Tax=Brevibacillus migulae TaxID=1644114 RepID=UPI00106E8963|nr:hypothetical protein [Brevibacillus migulae]